MKNHLRSLFLIIAITLMHYSIGYSQCLIYTFDGEAGHFGNSVASAGDVNNDGIKDYIIGADEYSHATFRKGRAYVYSGKTGELLYIFTGEADEDRLGNSVASAGDVNNDGYDDVVIGAYRYGGVGSRTGRAYVFSGKTGDTLYVFSGVTGVDNLGWSVAPAGDVNLDGYDDVTIGAPGHDSFGRVYIFSGKTGDTLNYFDRGALGNNLGGSFSSGVDVNQDGFIDIILGVPNGFNGGPQLAYVVTGQTGDTLYSFDGGTGRNWFGNSVSWAGDVDLDGFVDMLIGAPGYYDAGFIGRVYVFSGQTGDTLMVLEGESGGDRFGGSVCTVGDVNDDLRADFLVGAWGSGALSEGEAFVYSGKTGEILQSFSGEATFDHFGWSVASSGGIEIDGYVDIIIGAPYTNISGSVETQAGRVYVYSDRGCWGTRGDFNGDGTDANILDLTYSVDFIFRAGTGVTCPLEGDINSDGNSSDILDLTYLVDYIFRGGPAPGSC